jgi:hypothetical protein
MSYRYDKHNNITSIVNSITNETHNYSYDDMDRITNWQYSNNSYSTQKDRVLLSILLVSWLAVLYVILPAPVLKVRLFWMS